MDNMHTDLPKTINEALKILAYNDYFWANPGMLGNTAPIKPHPKDKETVRSLADSQYRWTEKQARLAVVLLKRYLTKFQQHGMDIKKLLDNPVYDEEFRVIDFEKSIEKFTDKEGVDRIEIKFPYNKKIVQLIRCLKDRKNLPNAYSTYDGDTKKWIFKHSDMTAYYLTLMGVRYDFKFTDDALLKDYDLIRKSIKGFKKPSARLVAGQVVIDNVSDSLRTFWNENLQNKKVIHQTDALKNLGISAKGLNVKSETVLGGKIANNDHKHLWIDSKSYSKNDIVKALFELDAFPIIMPCHSEMHDNKDVEEVWSWLNAFKSNGIDILTQCSWGFDVKEPMYSKDVDNMKHDKHVLISNHETNEFFQNLFELHQMSKQFKFIDEKTKIIFVRNRIPRALMKSKVKPKAGVISLGGGYYAGGTENLKRLLENLPKKLYYSDYQPSSWDWHDRSIMKI